MRIPVSRGRQAAPRENGGVGNRLSLNFPDEKEIFVQIVHKPFGLFLRLVYRSKRWKISATCRVEISPYIFYEGGFYYEAEKNSAQCYITISFVKENKNIRKSCRDGAICRGGITKRRKNDENRK